MKAFKVLILLVILHLSFGPGDANKSGDDDNQKFSELNDLNSEQKATLAKLKESVSDKLHHDYMKEDIFLVKFLQATSWDGKKAESMVLKSMDFRKENNVDSWEEDKKLFGNFEKEYPFRKMGFDKIGRPVQMAHFKDWNVRKASEDSATMTKLIHYSLRPVERSNTKNREKHAQGHNNTQFMLLWNFEGFNTMQHGCPSCMRLYTDYTKLYEANWPNSFYHVVLVNAPRMFESTYNTFKPFMSEKTTSIFKVFDSNRNVWWAYLENYIDAKLLEEYFDKSDEDMFKGKEKHMDKGKDMDEEKEMDKEKAKKKFKGGGGAEKNSGWSGGFGK